MSELTTEDKLYIEDMDLWIHEQILRCKEIECAINTSTKIAELNRRQLQVMVERYNIGITKHNEWLKSKGIEPIVPLMGELNGAEV